MRQGEWGALEEAAVEEWDAEEVTGCDEWNSVMRRRRKQF